MSLFTRPHRRIDRRPAPYPAPNFSSRQARGLKAWYPLWGLDTKDYITGMFNGAAWTAPISPATPRVEYDGGTAAHLFDTALSPNYTALPVLSTLATASEWMITIWARPLSEIIVDNDFVFTSRGIVADAGAYMGLFQFRTGGVSYFSAYNFDNSVDEARGSPIVIDTPTHIAGVHVANTLYIFINGRQIASTASFNTTNITNVVRIGRGYDDINYPDNGFYGELWDARFYNPVPQNFAQIIYDIWNPTTRYDLYKPYRRRLYVSAPAAATNISATTGHETWNGLSASVRANTNILTTLSSGGGSEIWNGLTASVRANTNILATRGSETWNGLTANIIVPTVILATRGSETWSGLTASINARTQVNATLGVETWSGLSASINARTQVNASLGVETWNGLGANVLVSGPLNIQATRGTEIWGSGGQATITAGGVAGTTQHPFRIFRAGKAKRGPIYRG